MGRGCKRVLGPWFETRGLAAALLTMRESRLEAVLLRLRDLRAARRRRSGRGRGLLLGAAAELVEHAAALLLLAGEDRGRRPVVAGNEREQQAGDEEAGRQDRGRAGEHVGGAAAGHE